MSRKKEMYLVIDTETCNTLEQPFVYDIGYAICDRNGNIVIEKSFLVADIFIGCQDVMKSAYYSEKIPQYWDKVKNKEIVIKSIFNIRKEIKEDIKKYNIKNVCAYNMGFDKRALNNTIRYCSKSFIRWFFPFGMQYICIWNMACQVIMNTKKYVKFAVANGLISASGNMKTSAECCYQYLLDNVDFIESHTGLEDVKIEVEIMAKCFQSHSKINKNISSSCWRIPQKKFKKYIDKL